MMTDDTQSTAEAETATVDSFIAELITRLQVVDHLTTMVIGRSADCDIVVTHPAVSRRHACVAHGETTTAQDLESRNGTFIERNGRTIRVDRTPVQLVAGDRLITREGVELYHL